MSLSNLKEVSSGYSNTTDVNSGFCFSSSSVPRSGSVFAKSRVSKRRSINRLHVNPDHSKASPGVNPFQFNSHASVPGSSSDAGNAPLASEYVFRSTMSDLRTAGVVEEMKNLKIERGNAFVNEKDGASSRCFDDSVASMLPEDMRKLKIEGSSENRPFERGSDAEFTASTLPEGMRKLKVEGSSENRPYEMGSDAKFIASTLPEGMRKLKIEGSSQERPFEMGSSAKLDVHTNEEVKIGPAIGGAVGGFPGKNVESTLPDELKMKLKINEKSRTNEHGGALVGNSAADVSNHEKNLDNREPAYSEKGLGKTDYNQKTAHRTSSVWEGSGNANAGDHISGIPENVLSKEIEEKLNIGRNSRASVAKPVFEEFSFKPRMAAKDAASGESHSHHLKDHLDVSAPATSLGAFSFSNLSSKAGNNVSGRNEKNDSFTFSSKRNDMKVPFVDFKMPVSKVNIVSGFPEKMEFTAKKEPFNSTKLKKKKGKPKQSTHVQSRLVQDFISAGGISLEKPEPSESYSPMDVSPYHEALADNPCSRGASVTSNESYGLDNTYASNASQSSVSNNEVDEELLLATQHMDINDYEQSREDKEDTTKQGLEQSICTEGPTAESGSAAETDSFQSAEEIDITRADFVALEDRNEASCSSKIDRNSDERRQERSLDSQVEEMRGSNFTFAASSVSQGLPSVPRHKPKKKTWIKSGHASFNFRSTAELPYASSSIQHFPSSVMSSPLSSQLERGDQTTSDYQVGKDFGVKVDSIRISTEAITQEECEKWRLRGNQAYAKGDMSKAEDYYTQGIHCVSRDETSRNCLRALMLCYSNRAATRMSLGKMRDAIGDCMMATTIDPNFFRVQVRAANCYLALGEIDDASRYYKKCLQVGSEVCVDRKVVVEASEGIQKAQKVSECTNHAAELLLARASKDVEIALGLIAEALAISLYSEKLLEMKAEALFMLGRYEAVIQLCEQTLHSAEKNSIPLNEKELCADPDGLEFSNTSYFRVWRSRQMFKSYFQLGRLEEGLASLERQEELWSATNRSGHTSLALLIPLVGTVRELVRLKAAGNDLFQAGRHAEAVENYTTALLCNIESRPFAAICFCNRAAAYKALGQITDAIADCSLAIALDGNYLKALSRRASLFEMIRDYGQAAADLQRLVLVLTRLVGEKNNQSGTYHKSLSSVNELKQARLRLTEIEEASRKDIPLDMYLILGVEPSASLPEIKKAYRKAALRHHPDKASQFLAKGDNGDDKTWKRMAEEVQKDTDRLFKMIGEAYAILSDPTKRLHYDLEEEKRNSEKKHNGSSTVRSYRDDQNQPFERSDGRQRWRDISRFYSTSQARGAEPNRWTRYL